jgi:hypothetical protein
MPTPELKRIDDHYIPDSQGEIRAFACIRNEVNRLPFLLDYHRELGIDRFFFIDNRSGDGTREFLLAQHDCHTFDCGGNFFAENVEPPIWTNALRNVFADGYWSVSLDADEMLVYPDCETVPLPRLCRYLDGSGADALHALVIDMYGRGPIVDTTYQRGQNFLDACPYFDPELGWTVAADGHFPPQLMFSRFRERAFWHGKHRRKRPPCITQVPLVKWRKSMAYLVAQHSLTHAHLSELQAAVLHFKFLPGFYESVVSSLEDNKSVVEKGLEERRSYVDALARDRALTLFHKGSVRYKDSRQLVSLGWMKTSPAYATFAKQSTRGHAAHSRRRAVA